MSKKFVGCPLSMLRMNHTSSFYFGAQVLFRSLDSRGARTACQHRVTIW